MMQKIKTRIAGFADEHPRAAAAAVSCGAMGLAAASMLGSASAEITEATTSFYGLSVIDWLLSIVGAVGFLAGLFLRDFRVVLIGAFVMLMGGIAFYLGV